MQQLTVRLELPVALVQTQFFHQLLLPVEAEEVKLIPLEAMVVLVEAMVIVVREQEDKEILHLLVHHKEIMVLNIPLVTEEVVAVALLLQDLQLRV